MWESGGRLNHLSSHKLSSIESQHCQNWRAPWNVWSAGATGHWVLIWLQPEWPLVTTSEGDPTAPGVASFPSCVSLWYFLRKHEAGLVCCYSVWVTRHRNKYFLNEWTNHWARFHILFNLEPRLMSLFIWIAAGLTAEGKEILNCRWDLQASAQRRTLPPLGFHCQSQLCSQVCFSEEGK